jgi:hypothetical protein
LHKFCNAANTHKNIHTHTQVTAKLLLLVLIEQARRRPWHGWSSPENKLTCQFSFGKTTLNRLYPKESNSYYSPRGGVIPVE